MSTSAVTAVSTTYTVTGMTCGHCVSSVTAGIGKVAGVTGVQVDLATGRVTVASDRVLDDAAVTAAVGEAGYQVVAPATEAPAEGASCCGSCN
ncbi:heavy-metal-associated domain-containing protein [Streptodolium elevatio]|uniref:Cation transporter n=1 Tax=Streptodolium elevatio TaxID=3157996 RepID=A0ABV3DQV3_9ACTN